MDMNKKMNQKGYMNSKRKMNMNKKAQTGARIFVFLLLLVDLIFIAYLVYSNFYVNVGEENLKAGISVSEQEEVTSQVVSEGVCTEEMCGNFVKDGLEYNCLPCPSTVFGRENKNNNDNKNNDLTDNLVLHLKFDNNFKDSSENDLNGEFIGVGNADFENGVDKDSDEAICFSGEGYVEIPNTGNKLNLLKKVTI